MQLSFKLRAFLVRLYIPTIVIRRKTDSVIAGGPWLELKYDWFCLEPGSNASEARDKANGSNGERPFRCRTVKTFYFDRTI